MKRFLYLVVLFVALLTLSGCIKYDGTMTINADKSMKLSITYAVDTSYFNVTDLFDDNTITKARESGLAITNYSEEEMEGYIFTYNVANIDTISTEEDVTYSLSNIDNITTSKVFKVEKGKTKNTYTANFVFDSSDSNISVEDEVEVDDNTTVDTNTNTVVAPVANEVEEKTITATNTVGATNTTTTTGTDDLSKALTSSMDLSFTVVLPNEVIDTNASKVSDDKKTLTWNLTSDGAQNISFQFALDNQKTSGDYSLYIYIGCGALLVIAIVLLVIGRKGKKKEEPAPVEEAPVVEGTNEVNPAPVVEETPVTEPAPVVEETPTVEEEKPAVEEVPVMDAPVVDAPVVEENPAVTEPAPVVEETPTVEEAKPAVEEVPVMDAPVIDAPVVEETPVVTEPAPAEEAPAAEAPIVPSAEEQVVELPKLDQSEDNKAN